jgi:hypothetical protein
MKLTVLENPLKCSKLPMSFYHFCLAGRYNKLQDQYSEAVNSIQEQKRLIVQLEEDLRSVNAWSAMFRGDAEVTSKYSLLLILGPSFSKTVCLTRVVEFNLIIKFCS